MAHSHFTFDALRLARKGETLQGELAVADLPRLAPSVLDPAARIRYQVSGQIDDKGHPGARMVLSGELPLRCERCNAPLPFELDRDVQFRFVDSEETLNTLPIEDDEVEEVIGSPAMALVPWIEDEVILSLPLVPRHAHCNVPLPFGEAAQAEERGRPNPFAVLSGLKRGEQGDGGHGGGETQ